VKRHVLDTSILLYHWHRSVSSPLERLTVDDARRWARKLIDLQETDVIVTLVFLEVLCSARSAHEMRLTGGYLAEFRILDGGQVTKED
jgi:predicted nucleic acid-binding protein